MAGIWDIATDPRILDHVEDIVGPDIVCWASAILSKKPGDTREVPWHQDASFWKLTPARTVTVWLAIDDADAENAAMRFIPGTHGKGAIATIGDGRGVGLSQGDRRRRKLRRSLRQRAEGRADLASCRHCWSMARGPNRSARRRCGLTLRYCPPEVRINRPGLGPRRGGDHRARRRPLAALAPSSAPRQRRHSGDNARPMSWATTDVAAGEGRGCRSHGWATRRSG